MKNIASRMLLLICAAAICTLFAGISAPAAAAQYEKALHVVADHRLKPNTISEIDDLIKVYDVKSDGCPINPQNYPILSDEQPACDLAMFDDPNGDGKPDDALVFVTYKGSNQVDVYKAVALVHFGTVFVTGAKGDPEDLAGIVVEKVSPGKGRFYTVDRYTQDLYIYDITVTSSAVTLKPAPGYSLPITLDGIQPKAYLQGAVGLAMGLGVSAEGPLLFVTDFTNTIHYYDTTINLTNTWFEAGTILIPVSVECGVARKVSIAYDEVQKIVYAAGGFNVDNCLHKYDMTSDDDKFDPVNLRLDYGYRGGPIGLAVDPDKDRLYVTTGFSGEILRVFNSKLVSVCPELDGKIIDPAETRPGFAGVCAQQRGPKFLDLTGICIGPRVKQQLKLTKTQVIPSNNGCVEPGENVKFKICVENTGSNDVHNVEVTDHLPEKTTFISSTPAPTSSTATTLTWDFDTIGGGQEKCVVELILRVDLDAPRDKILEGGYCIVRSDETGESKPEPQPVKVCPEHVLKLIKTQTHPANNGCVEPGENVKFKICVENTGSNDVHNVEVTDHLPEKTTFISSTPAPTSSTATTLTWDFDTIGGGQEKCVVELILRVDLDAPRDKILEGGYCIVRSDETGESKPEPQPVKVCPEHDLGLIKTQIDPPLKGCVEPEENMTFRICVENTGSDDVHNVVVTDHLPPKTTFKRAAPAGTYDSSARTVTWNLKTIEPGQKKCVEELVLEVNSDATPGEILKGYCTVRSDETPESERVPQPVLVCGQPTGGGNRPEFDTVGCDATNYFALRDGIMPRVVENAVDALGKKINLYSDFVPQGREYFTQTASDLYPDPCFPGYMSAYVDSSNQGIYEWLIVLQMKPESDIDLNIYDCVMKRYGASVWKSAGQTGWHTTDGGDDPSFWAAANPTVTVAVVPGPYATPGFDAPFYLDGRTLTGLLPVSLVDVPYTSKAFWEEGIVIEMPMTGSINCLGETVYDLKQGDAIKVTISIPTKNTVDIRYGKDNVILKYIGIVATEHCTDDACAQ